jgi:hypothetical protein
MDKKDIAMMVVNNVKRDGIGICYYYNGIDMKENGEIILKREKEFYLS